MNQASTMKLLLHVRRTDVTSYGGPHAPPIEALVPAMNRFFDRTLGPVRAEMIKVGTGLPAA